jgi:hypothetical protein
LPKGGGGLRWGVEAYGESDWGFAVLVCAIVFVLSGVGRTLALAGLGRRWIAWLAWPFGLSLVVGAFSFVLLHQGAR